MAVNNEEIVNRNSKNSNKKSRKLIGFLIPVIVISAIVIVVLSYKWKAHQTVKSVEITGNLIVPTSEIKALISDSVLKKPVEKVKLSDIQKKLKSHPFIESSVINYKSPEQITILVKEREPVAVLVLDDGMMLFADESGRTLPYRLFDKFPDLPLIRNIGNSEKIDKNAISKCLEIIREMRKEENRYLYHYISEIIYEASDCSAKISTRQKDIIIDFGGIWGISEKIEKLKLYWESESPFAESSGLRSINLKWNNYIVATYSN